MRPSITVAGLLGVATMLAVGTASAAPAANSSLRPTIAVGTFEAYKEDASAVTYDTKLVPAGANAVVVATPLPKRRTIVFLALRGLVPNRTYGAHVHVKGCGPAPADAGPHYQHVVDPVQPSVDPAYANPRNEIWLDLTTDSFGNALVQSTVDWRFPERQQRSVVVHAEHTHVDPGHAGTAGARLGCVNVKF